VIQSWFRNSLVVLHQAVSFMFIRKSDVAESRLFGTRSGGT